MSDLAGDIRLAVDSGSVAIGVNSVTKSVNNNTAKAIVIASKNKREISEDIRHIAKIANIRVIEFVGNTVELGSLCGKSFSVSVLAVINPGNSNILNADYSITQAQAAPKKERAKKAKKVKKEEEIESENETEAEEVEAEEQEESEENEEVTGDMKDADEASEKEVDVDEKEGAQEDE